jgi:hypothetical protein
MALKPDMNNVIIEADKNWIGGGTVIFKMPASEGLRERSLHFRFENAESVEEGRREAARPLRRVADYFQGLADLAEG